MPISSGANGWPNAYRVFQKFKSQKAEKTSPPSPPPPYTTAQPQPYTITQPQPYTTTQPQPHTRTQPKPRPIYIRYPHSSRPSPPPKEQPTTDPNSYSCFGGPGGGGPCGSGGGGGPCGSGGGGGGGPCGSGGGGRCGSGGGPCGSGGSGGSGGPCGPPSGHDGAGPCCCFCGGSALYTTGVAGANAGCFQGGMFSSKNPAYPAGQSNYALQNQGRHRCCACVTGMIIGLLLLGLILGCLLAVDPLLKTRSKVSTYLTNNPGAYQIGDYIVVPKETYVDYYKVNGAEEPCNPYNNASDYPDPTAGILLVSDQTTLQVPITDPVLELLPDCDSLTTNIVFTYSVPITGPTVIATILSGQPAAAANVCVVTAAGLFAMNIGFCAFG